MSRGSDEHFPCLVRHRISAKIFSADVVLVRYSFTGTRSFEYVIRYTIRIFGEPVRVSLQATASICCILIFILTLKWFGNIEFVPGDDCKLRLSVLFDKQLSNTDTDQQQH